MAKIKVVQVMNFPKKWSYYICKYHFEKALRDFVGSVIEVIDETDRRRSELSVAKEALR